jgi:carbohydrate diacid regulator
MALSLLAPMQHIDSNVQRMIDSSEKIIKSIIRENKNSVYFKNGIELLCALPNCLDDTVIKIAERMKLEIESKYPITFCCGIDAACEDYLLIHSSVMKAEKALKTSIRSPQKGIRLYESITMEIFQTELSSETKLEYIKRIFKNCTIEEIENWIGVLNVFYEEEGSIVSTAQRLYIHKNTLQYKLNKIKVRTGYDPRSIRYSSLYYNAIHFYQDVRNKMIL